MPVSCRARSSLRSFRICACIGPERLGLGGPNIHAQNLAPAITVDADRDDNRNRHNAPTLAHLQVGRVDPQIGPVAFKRATQEGFYLLVDLLAQSADLALGDAGHAHGLDQIIDRAGRDAVYVGFLHHCGRRLLRQPARLQESRKLAALAQLRKRSSTVAGGLGVIRGPISSKKPPRKLEYFVRGLF